MTQRNSTTMLLGAVAAGLALAACGSPGQPSSASPNAVSGTASTGASGATVTLKDSSTPAKVATATAAADGSYAVDVGGLTAPYAIRAQWKGATGSGRLYSMATGPGTANVNVLTDAAFAAVSASGDSDGEYDGFDGKEGHSAASGFMDVIEQLQTVLKPLFDLYGVTSPLGDDASRERSGLSALLKDVQITISGGTVTVTNRATGGVIFTGPLGDLASGTFTPGNMPAGPGTGTPPAACTSFTYSTWGACQPDGTQTRTVAGSSPAGCTGGSPVLTQACAYVPPPPPACTYTYSAWSTCSASGTQTRTVLTTSPAGCTGTPVLSQACTPPAANPVTPAMVVSSCTSCHGLTSNTTVFRSGGYAVTGRTASQWLTTVNNMVALGSTLAPGTTAQNYADYLANVP